MKIGEEVRTGYTDRVINWMDKIHAEIQVREASQTQETTGRTGPSSQVPIINNNNLTEEHLRGGQERNPELEEGVEGTQSGSPKEDSSDPDSFVHLLDQILEEDKQRREKKREARRLRREEEKKARELRLSDIKRWQKESKVLEGKINRLQGREGSLKSRLRQESVEENVLEPNQEEEHGEVDPCMGSGEEGTTAKTKNRKKHRKGKRRSELRKDPKTSDVPQMGENMVRKKFIKSADEADSPRLHQEDHLLKRMEEFISKSSTCSSEATLEELDALLDQLNQEESEIVKAMESLPSDEKSHSSDSRQEIRQEDTSLEPEEARMESQEWITVQRRRRTLVVKTGVQHQHRDLVHQREEQDSGIFEDFDSRTPKKGPDKEEHSGLAQTSENHKSGAGQTSLENLFRNDTSQSLQIIRQQETSRASQESKNSSILESIYDSRSPKKGPDKEVLPDPIKRSELLKSEDEGVFSRNRETSESLSNETDRIRSERGRTSEVGNRVDGSVRSGQTGCLPRRLRSEIFGRAHRVEPRFNSQRPKKGPDKKPKLQRVREKRYNQPAKRNGNGPRERKMN
jgi:hypothetical protein